VVGLQFHLEVDRLGVEGLLQHCSEELTNAPWVQSAEMIRKKMDGIGQFSTNLEHFLNTFEKHLF
jgi:hypothetical protein